MEEIIFTKHIVLNKQLWNDVININLCESSKIFFQQ